MNQEFIYRVSAEVTNENSISHLSYEPISNGTRPPRSAGTWTPFFQPDEKSKKAVVFVNASLKKKGNLAAIAIINVKEGLQELLQKDFCRTITIKEKVDRFEISIDSISGKSPSQDFYFKVDKHTGKVSDVVRPQAE